MAQSEDHIWADSRVRFCGVVAETLTESLRSAGRSGGRRGLRRRGCFRALFAMGRGFANNSVLLPKTSLLYHTNRGGRPPYTAILHTDFLRGHGHRIVDARFGDNLFDH